MGAADQGADAVETRWMVLPRTLCFVRNGGDVLLMKRAPTRRVFPNFFNGVGGHIERDEDVLTSVRREVLEETGLYVSDVRLQAVYNIDAGNPSGIVLFVFTAWSESREVIDSDEGTLHWVPRESLGTLDLVDDLPMLLPRILDRPQAVPLFVHLSYDPSDRLLMRFADPAP
jgi:8-oxo-dGTP diphosphatase